MIWSGQAWAHRALYNITRSFPATFPVLKATRLPLPALLQQAASGQYYVSILKLPQLGINRSQISFRITMQHYSDSLIRHRILLREVGVVESTFLVHQLDASYGDIGTGVPILPMHLTELNFLHGPSPQIRMSSDRRHGSNVPLVVILVFCDSRLRIMT